MPAVLLDENMALRLVDELHQRGFDVITIKSLGLNDRKTPDAEVFAVAVSLQRILITHNHAHFRKLHAADAGHFGIVSCTEDLDVVRLANNIAGAIANSGDCARKFIRVVRGN